MINEGRLNIKIILLISFFGLFSASGQVTCPTLNGPFNGANNVPVDTTISWTSIEGVPGYLISIGTTSGGNDIINSVNVGIATTYTPPLGLPKNSTIYVTLTIFFFNAPDITCTSESFSTADVTSLGWDGTFNGVNLPATDYWFTSISLSTQNEIKGHFTLKR